MCKKILSDKQRLKKKAAAKFLSHGLSIKLTKANPTSILKASYDRSLDCASRLNQFGSRITSKYCKNRWCAVCNRIRTAKIMNGYAPAIKQLQEAESCYFVTLTKKTVTAYDLPESISLMESTWRRVMTSKTNRKRKVIGLRKAECTIRPNGHYHYHYHVIIQGKENAQWLKDAWLERLENQADKNAQDIRFLDSNSLHEMFKYFTKLTTSKKDKTEERELYDPKRMDVIFRAIRGKRTFQPFGGLKQISEEIETLIVEEYNEITPAIKQWNWKGQDWFDKDGDKLANYKPAEKLKDLFKEDSITDSVPVLDLFTPKNKDPDL